ncbi:MAG: phosphoglucosamine mutase [Acidobacteriota bacterium]
MTKTETPIPRLFGTDGVRGVAGRYPLDRATVRRLGAALVRGLPRGTAPPRILVGRDTRESGGWIERELAAGARGEGAVTTSAGVVPTPAVAYLTRSEGFDAGVVISASHNPFEDNGLKVFSGRGEKFSERVEREMEAIVADPGLVVDEREAEPVPSADLVDAYLDHLRRVIPDTTLLKGWVIGIDCANGATTPVAAGLFESLGVQTVVIGDRPDGRNINLDCGSLHPERLARAVVSEGCRMGVAFDGDGDRAIFVDHTGRVVNGDAVLLMCSRQLQREGRLRGDAIVATVMSNIGLEMALHASGIGMVRCAVGDKYVMEEMQNRGLSLGGEQSGHIIFSDYLFTGDGLCTALNVLRTVAVTARTLADLASDLTSYPQVLLNVRVRERVDLSTVPAIVAAMSEVESRLDNQGRLLVRYSGTEPLLRVMLEGKDEGELRAWAQQIVDVVKEQLG